jgi:hypothetical protein
VTRGTDFGGSGRKAHRIMGFHDGANRVVGSDNGGAEEQPRAPARGSREHPASVRSLGRCREVQRGGGAVVCGGSMTASTAAQWQQQTTEEKRVAPRGVLLL